VVHDAAGWVALDKEPVGGKIQIRNFLPDGTPGAFLTTEPADIGPSLGPLVTPIGVVWEEGGVLKRVARSGGAVVALQTTPVTSFRMDADSLYILASAQNGAPNGGALFKYTKGSLSPATLYALTDKDQYSDLALDGVGGLFLKCYGAFIGGCKNAVYEGSTTGAALTLTYADYPGDNTIPTLVAGPGQVFGFGFSNPQPTWGVMIKLDLAGPTRTELIPAGPNLGAINQAIVDGPWVYFSVWGAGGAIYRVATAGGTPEKLYDISPTTSLYLHQDADYLYFYTPGVGHNRLRKPVPLRRVD
jgi:hypothetical protein